MAQISDSNKRTHPEKTPPNQSQKTESTADVFREHGLKGLFLVLVFGLHDPSQGISGVLSKKFVSKILEWIEAHPRLTQISGYLAAFSFLMTFVPGLLNDFWLWSRERLYASVTIGKYDTALHTNVMDFIVRKAIFKTRRALHAESLCSFKNRNVASTMSTHDQQVVFKGSSKKMQLFRHNGKPFLFTDEEEAGKIKLWCFGSLPKPIEDLLIEIQITRESEKQETRIRVFGVGYEGWNELESAKRRGMGSVFMDPGLKRELMNDFTVFLSDGAEKWYDQRGANYRRGYLFHGKPGCGKTSFIKAIASHFNMNIYTLWLTDKSINDNVLTTLFGHLRKNDLLVLEDVDCAGLLNRADECEEATTEADSGYNSMEEELVQFRSQQIAKRARKHKKEAKKQAKQGKTQQYMTGLPSKPKPEVFKKEEPKTEPLTNVTLSNLLNTMDGISSSTGYILIMTTNKPQALDEALRRAGRIERVVEFGNMTRNTAHDMFEFYSQPIDKEHCSYDIESIPKLAIRFAKQLPEDELSPAQVQSYLLRYPSVPAEAVKNMTKWIQEEKERAKVFSQCRAGAEKNKQRV